MDTQNKPILRNIDQQNQSSDIITMKFFIILIAGALIVGTGVGFIASKVSGTKSTSASGKTVKTEKAAGIKDTKTFKDKAEGMLRAGGIEDEGSYHLEQKPGDKSQDVALTSSTVDLSQYVGKKVRVWGATFQAEKAGWLMDVGYVEVLQ